MALAEQKFDEERALHLAREYVPLLRSGEAFSHTTALLLHGAPVRCAPVVHVTIPLPHGQARDRHVIGHRTRIPFDSTRGIAALPCVPLVMAIVQSALLLSFRELVVAIDHLLRTGRSAGRQGLGRGARMLDAQLQRPTRGARRLRAAFQVARIGADSRMESLLHFEFARLGIDTLELQANVLDAQGLWIGRFDQLDRESRRIVEYDGEQHRTSRTQYLADLRRLDRAREAGFSILRLHAEDLADEALRSTRDRICRFLESTPRPIPRSLAPYFAEPLHLPRPNDALSPAANL